MTLEHQPQQKWAERRKILRPLLRLGCAFVAMGALFFIMWVGMMLYVGFQIAKSHVDANMPPTEQFEAITTRDLQSYFRERTGKPVRVKWEWLMGPVQTGIAYPKFYFWVQIYEGDVLIDEGAVRVAAVAQTRMDVTDYMSTDTIRANPQRVCWLFPKPACEGIFARANVTPPSP